MGEGRTEPPSRRLTVDQAADALGVTTEAIRGRIRRKTIRAERVGGRVYVLLPAEQSGEQTPDHTPELVERLREEVSYLRGVIATRDQELAQRAEEIRRRDAAIERQQELTAMFAERLRQLEAPPSPEPSEQREASRRSAVSRQLTTAVVFWVLLILAVGGSTIAILLQQYLSHTQRGSEIDLLTNGFFLLFVLPFIFGFLFGQNNGHLVMFWRRGIWVGPIRAKPPPDAFFSAVMVGLGVLIASSTFMLVFIGLRRLFASNYFMPALGGAAVTTMLFVFAALIGRSLQTWDTADAGRAPIVQAIIGLVGTVITVVGGLVAGT